MGIEYSYKGVALEEKKGGGMGLPFASRGPGNE